MKNAKLKTDLRLLDIKDLIVRREQAAKELLSLRLQKRSGSVKNTSLFGVLRKLIARINTFVREKQVHE